MKICTKCKKEKSLDKFYKDLQKKDGLHCACKECKSKDAKIYKSKNSERLKLTAKEYDRERKEKGELTKRGLQVIKLAKKFETLKDFKDKYPLEYSYANKSGISTIALSHLKRDRTYIKDNPNGRICGKCGIFKTWDCFYYASKKKGYIRYQCKV